MIKKIITKILPGPLKGALKKMLLAIVGPCPDVAYGKISYSQEGEDIVLSRLMNSCGRKGFYVDVGAHHPKKFSNTAFFYRSGWRGINVDAAPGSMSAFERDRREDINVEVAIAKEKQTMKFYEFDAPELNSLDEELSRTRGADSTFPITRVTTVQAVPLTEVLDQYVPPGTRIDFMSIDVEGADLQVLESNNWEVYRPLIVLAEDSTSGTVKDSLQSPICQFMASVGYELVSRTALTLFFAEPANIKTGPWGVNIGWRSSKSINGTIADVSCSSYPTTSPTESAPVPRDGSSG